MRPSPSSPYSPYQLACAPLSSPLLGDCQIAATHLPIPHTGKATNVPPPDSLTPAEHAAPGPTWQVTSRPRSSEEEVAFILSTISDYIGVRVAPSDVLSTWSGIRPLASNPKVCGAVQLYTRLGVRF